MRNDESIRIETFSKTNASEHSKIKTIVIICQSTVFFSSIMGLL